MMSRTDEHLWTATQLILGVIDADDFALAGSGAIREHGITDRPTRDVDLFTTNRPAEAFSASVDRAIRVLSEAGYSVEVVRRADLFARLLADSPDGFSFEVDLGVDWRAHEPVRMAVGPVLALEDAVANKVNALYSRAEARDFADVDAIRQSGRFDDEELLLLAAEHDPGFDRSIFAGQLAVVRGLGPLSLSEYGVDSGSLTELQSRLGRWSASIQAELDDSKVTPTAVWERVDPPSLRHEPPPSATPDRPGLTP